MSEWIEKPSVPLEENGSNQLRTYTIHIKVEAPYPCPKHATPRMIGDEFVWERLIQTKGRARAVEEAGEWFRRVKQKDYAKGLKNKNAHECVTVDDKPNESKFGSDFKPTKNLNRLLDKETISRLLEESKGLLKVCDKPYGLTAHPSVDWVDETKKVNKNPIKIGLIAYSNPEAGMKDALVKAKRKASALKKKGKSWLRETTMDENRKLIRKMRENGSIKKDPKAEIAGSAKVIKDQEARIKELEKRLKEKGVIV